MPFIPSSATETDTLALLDLLAATVIGEVCTYAAMSAALGGREPASFRHLTLAAARRLNKDCGMLFSVVHRVGYKRLAPDEAHTIGAARRARIRRSAHRTAQAIAHTIDRANDMDPAAKRKAMGEISAMNMLAHLAQERVARTHDRPDKPAPLAETLRGVMDHLGISR